MRLPVRLKPRPPVLPLLRLLALIALLVLPYSRPVTATADYQILPFSQNWNDIGLITVNDNWNALPGIVGYRGDGLTAAENTDPQTILAADTPGVLDVNANQTNPTTFTSGGVTEFELTNPAVALNGSGIADAPYLLLHLNTTGKSNITVSYTVRDLDPSADNAVQQVALHYRVGTSGAFTNLPSGYVADATTGSTATRTTTVSLVLPVAAEGQPQLQLRIMTANAVGNDEAIGIDNISVTAGGIITNAAIVAACPTTLAATTGTATSGNLSASDSDGTVSTATITSAAVAGISLGSATPATTVGGTYLTTLQIADTTSIGTYTVEITFANNDATPQTTLCTVSVTVSTSVAVCEQTFTPIYSIQGSGAAAAVTGTVTTEGVVVGDYEGSAGLQGVYLQDATGDGDAATSDGIFVYTGSANTVSISQTVRVTGFARERFNETALNGSDGNSAAVLAASIVDCGPGSVAATPVSLPFADASFPERYEGMLITLPQSLVISEYFNYDRFGEYVLALPLAGESRPYTPTSVEVPGSPTYTNRLDLNLRSRILIDDARSAQNPASGNTHPNGQPYSLSNSFRGGDTVTSFTGVLGFGFSAYRVQPTTYGTYAVANPREAAPENVGGRLKVAAFNTLNYFLTPDYPTGNPLDNACSPAQNAECRGADSDQPDELTRQRAKLLATLTGLNADVVGLIELENTTDVEPMADIVAGLTGYDYIETGTIGTDAIKVGIIYKTATVTPTGSFAILDSSVDPRFIDTRNRPALAQTFTELSSGERFTVVVNHLKSKGSDCNTAIAPVGADPDVGDGQGNCNLTRTQAAEALVDWIASDPTASSDPDYLIVGDLNSYAKEDPIVALQNGGFDNLIARFKGPLAYSYNFDGQFGYLDYALANTSLAAQVSGVTEWHINSDEPDLLDYDTSLKSAVQDGYYAPNAFRASDHDPVLVGLLLQPTPLIPANLAGSSLDADIVVSANGKLGVITYTLTISNSGQVGTTFSLTDTLPSELRLLSAPGLTVSGQTLTASGSIAGGATVSYIILTELSATGSVSFTNQATLSGDGTTRTLTSATVNISVPASGGRLYLPIMRR